MALAALEPVFWAAFCKGFGILEKDWGGKREDRKSWPKIKEILREKFRSKTQGEWEAIFMGTDACCTPVLTYDQQQTRGYCHQLPIHLTGSAGIQLPTGAGQWEMEPIANGEGGERVLNEWLGYRKDAEYVIQKGVFEKVSGSKL
jgi:alpha-methylacyl-CoA racemase